MKETREIRKCDCCEKQDYFSHETYSGGYFPNWITLSVISSTGCSNITYETGEITGEHDFCSVDCAIKYLQAAKEKKEEERQEYEKRPKVPGIAFGDLFKAVDGED